MGWSSGSRVFDRVIAAARAAIPNTGARTAFYREVIPAFEDADWDTQEECAGEDDAYDSALAELHPDWAGER